MRYTIEEIPEVFSDIEPVDILDDDGVAAIAYSEPFRIAFGYWRAVLQQDERSERTLKLTATCLQLNPANYTVWHFRRLCLDAVHHPQQEEQQSSSSEPDFSYVPADLELAALLGGDNPKNYQIWYHRRALLEKIHQSAGDNEDASALFVQFCDSELTYIATVLQQDGKNYHAWSHRQWVVSTLDDAAVWQSELNLAETLIAADRRNNSAWNHRWYVTHRRDGAASKILSREAADAELEYVLTKSELILDPANESPWRYLIAVVKEQIFALEDGAQVMSLLSKVKERILALEFAPENVDGKATCPNLQSALIDLLEWKGDPESLQEAMERAQSLADKHDTIRKKYWQFRVEEMQSALLGQQAD